MDFVTKFRNLAELTEYFKDEQSCRDYLEAMRWNGRPECPFCQCQQVYRFSDGKYFKCKQCRKRFTVLIGTIFEDTKIPLRKWFIAIYILTSHKKGLSSCQLAKDIGITQKSAWHVNHRIRHALGLQAEPELSNTVEVDETYIGGKRKGQRGRGAAGKTPVVGVVERGGKVVTKPVKNVDGQTLKSFIAENVQQGSTVNTDSFRSYIGLEAQFKHYVINHSEGFFAKGTIHTNTIEGYWSLFKRGIIGIYHKVSSQHLHRYCTEFDYRYNSRKDKGEVARFEKTLQNCEGRLMYKTLTGKGH